MKKILYILPGIDGGGVGEIVCTYLSKIDKTKFCCDVAALDTPDGHIPFAYERLEKYANKIYLLNRRSYFKRIFQLCSLLKIGKYDIVHVHMSGISSFYLTFAWLYGVKVRIAHSHIAYKPKIGSPEWLKKNLNYLFKHFVTHRYGCGLKACQYLWGSLDKTVVMPNAIDLAKFKYNIVKAEEKRKDLKIDRTKHVFGTVGRFHNQKNPFFIINIIECLARQRTDFVFIWVGKGELKERIIKESENKGLSKYIKFLGARNDVADLLSLFEVFILPSLYEGLPIVGVESQATSVYSFFSNTITREIRISDYADFLDIINPQLWADRISNVFDSPYNRGNNQSMNKSLYNIDVAVKELEKKYLEYCSNE